MRPEARLAATIELLEVIQATPRPADAAMREYFRARRYIGAKDRGEIAGSVWQTIRAAARLSWWLKDETPKLPGRLAALAYEMLARGKSLDDLARLCSGQEYAPTAITETERRVLLRLDRHTLDHPETPEATRLECPDWAYGALKGVYGERLAPLLRSLMEEAPLDLRVNTLKTTRPEMLAALRDSGLEASLGALSPLALRVTGRPNIGGLSEVQNGLLEVQDEAAQVASLLLGAEPGERIVDFCAGAGGKTLALAATMRNKGRIIACDVLEGRLKKAVLRFRRAGAFNIETRPITGVTDPWIKRHKQSFDRVFVDAPCSGAGTWRRNPDSRWRRLGPDLAELVELQKEILASAARLVRPGGRLLYATCSLLPVENREQVATFLETHPDFQLVPIPDVWRKTIGILSAQDGGEAIAVPTGAEDTLTLDPASNATDGFFVAVMQRTEAPAE